MWVPVAGLSRRLTLSAFSGAGRFCLWRSGAARGKDVAARNLSDFQPQPSEGFRELSSGVSKSRLESKRYILSPRLAETLVQFLLKKDGCNLILEFNPGPGILTQALLERGATVIALESDKAFIPHLESLGKKLGGKLHLIHCDFFKLDPRSFGVVKPVVNSKLLFQNFGIETLRWSEGIPLKVVGIFPTKNEKKMMWKLLHDVYSCTSLYRYGRVELNLFFNETDCQRILANPQNPNMYYAVSVLWQVACKVKLLHMEPWSSFDISTQSGQLGKPESTESLEQQIQQNLCFIQFTPYRNLFTQNLTPVNYDVFFHMVKQCFLKRNGKLINHLNSLSPIDAMDILKKIKQEKRTKIIDMYPSDFKRLFETIECSKSHTCKWLYNDFMEEVVI
ncbi:PREDICTED: dimethyladenosine transferase 2, mitochondrial [Miniopterus natalensis]|uniref:dimethyladenosine transferase 2, mitochondrial n=1 Tax=Miniopterus natalensis TaxID=291302 RepID=UPI0007A701CC|nr:PREDICTED: dimethyladenosine transferase 2, mitochondrial [Miniopterus natalensis]